MNCGSLHQNSAGSHELVAKLNQTRIMVQCECVTMLVIQSETLKIGITFSPLIFRRVNFSLQVSQPKFYMPRPSHLPWFFYPCNRSFWWRVKISGFFVKYFSPVSCHFSPARSRYCPQLFSKALTLMWENIYISLVGCLIVLHFELVLWRGYMEVKFYVRFSTAVSIPSI